MNLLHNEIEDILTPGLIVQHYKRAAYVKEHKDDADFDKYRYLYQVCGIATNTDNGKHFAIYQALYGRREVYARQLEEYIGTADIKTLTNVETVPRFTVYRNPVDPEPIQTPNVPKKHNAEKKLHKKIKSLSDEVKKLREENDQLKKEASARDILKKSPKKPEAVSNDINTLPKSYIAEAATAAISKLKEVPQIKAHSVEAHDLADKLTGVVKDSMHKVCDEVKKESKKPADEKEATKSE